MLAEKADAPAAPSANKIEVTPSTSGGASQPTATSEELKAALRQQVERYWAARQARDVRTMYEMESAARPGGWLKLENAMSLQGLAVRKVRVEEVNIEAEQGKARIRGEVLIGAMGWVPQTLEQTWVLIDGQWYHETQR
ncbi:MAG: hypothetical protein P9E67_08285 [Candidatus Competibacter sp.]|nr:hypothetical protein [Candidatus Competibacter sp.]